MIIFEEKSGKVILSYASDRQDTRWVYEGLKEKGRVTISKAFHLSKAHLITEYEESAFEAGIDFAVATLDGEYFRFSKDILGLDYDLFITRNFKLKRKTFVAERGISIFPRLEKVVGKSIYIGGENADAIPEEVFKTLLEKFPNTTELDKYAAARIDGILSTALDTMDDFESRYQTYLNRKPSIKGANLEKVFLSTDLIKYKGLLEKLSSMLSKPENQYNENQWQEEILEIILLLYPKYIRAFKSARVKDDYQNTVRKIDILLIDASGNVDIIEIKKPFTQSIVTVKTYRDNHIPLRELSGSVMQVEKYIFHLNKSGKQGEESLTKQYKSQLPEDFEIRITNPNGIIIMGRAYGLTDVQLQDFEVIKRKYKNVIDIMTYDDLLQRLQFTIDALTLKQVELGAS